METQTQEAQEMAATTAETSPGLSEIELSFTENLIPVQIPVKQFDNQARKVRCRPISEFGGICCAGRYHRQLFGYKARWSGVPVFQRIQTGACICGFRVRSS